MPPLPHPTLHSLLDAQDNFDALSRQAPSDAGGLPLAPFDGQEIYYAAAAGVTWHLRFRASTGKWEYLGGSPLRAENSTNPHSTASTTYQTTNIPSVTVPFAGDYDVTFGAVLAANGTSTANDMRTGLHVAGVVASEPAVQAPTASTGAGGPINVPTRRTGVPAGAVLDVRYRSASGLSASFYTLFLEVRPVQLG